MIEQTKKYQDALDRIKTCPDFMPAPSAYRNYTQSSIPFMEDINTLQELIDMFEFKCGFYD